MRFRIFIVAAAVGWLATVHAGRTPAQVLEAPAPTPDQREGEILLQGPIHEAFAKPIYTDSNADAAEPVVAPQAPPAPIEEIPPEVKPADPTAIWIPGYWAWDPVQEDFVWVSGVWRVPPPDSQWVPGYWMQIESGYQWVPGFWTSVETQEVEYLPYPPASLERGPTSPAPPSGNYFWVSGCWVYRADGYVWRPGYWAPYTENWVWTPAHYIYTPIGAVFCDGFWDYPIVRRGQIFAPVYFHHHAHVQHIRYTPRVAIDATHLLIHLFVNPRHRHYYYGNFYEPRYQTIGFHPWAEYISRTRVYDPLFVYYSTYYRSRGVDYAQRLQGWHDYFRRHEEYRPPRTWAEQAKLASRAAGNDYLRYSLIGRSVDQIWEDRNWRQRVERVGDAERRALARSSAEAQRLMRERLQAESRLADSARDRGRDRDQDELRRPRGRFQLPNTTAFRAPPRRGEGDIRSEDGRPRPHVPPRRPDEASRIARPDERGRHPGELERDRELRRAYRPDVERPDFDRKEREGQDRPRLPGIRPDATQPMPREGERDATDRKRPSELRPGDDRRLDRGPVQRPTPQPEGRDRVEPDRTPTLPPGLRDGRPGQPQTPDARRSGRDERPRLPTPQGGNATRPLTPGQLGQPRPTTPPTRDIPQPKRDAQQPGHRPTTGQPPAPSGMQDRSYRPPQLDLDRGRGTAPAQLPPQQRPPNVQSGDRGPAAGLRPPTARGTDGAADPRRSLPGAGRSIEQPRPRPEATPPRTLPGAGASRPPQQPSIQPSQKTRPPQAKSAKPSRPARPEQPKRDRN